MVKDAEFYDEARAQSVMKTRIVEKYFVVWAKIITAALQRRGQTALAYIDLFCGPGRYKDGTESTPLKVLKRAVEIPALRDGLVTLFNDVDPKHTAALAEAIEHLPGIDMLKHPPRIYTNEIGLDVAREFSQKALVPTFCFIDPFGYKGVSLDLIAALVKDWGSDAVIFFNYNRINAAISNDAIREHVDLLFGRERVEKMRAALDGLSPEEREGMILEQFSEALAERGIEFVLPFQFAPDGNKTSHYLIFVTKAFKGYEIMKDVMAGVSPGEDGVPTFRYAEVTEKNPLLFRLSIPIGALRAMLEEDFAGRELTMREIYEQHSVGTPFIAKNYKEALLTLESEGRIETVSKPGRRRGTFADDVVACFPPKGEE
jgi:three-Cys-motif partner protein